MNRRWASLALVLLAMASLGSAASAGARSLYTYMPTLGFEVAHDGRYYLVPAVYDPERRRLAYFGYPSWGVASGWGWSNWSPYGGWPAGTWAWPYPNDYAGDPLYEVPRRVEPRPTVPAPAEASPALAAPTLAELGADALHRGDFERAAAIYERLNRERVESEAAAPVAPIADRTALRLRALALAGAGRHAEAQQAMTRAAKEDPAASGGTVNARASLGGAETLRRIVLGAVRYAHTAASSDGWRYVAVLMEYENRPRQAEAMRRRAEDLQRRATPPAAKRSPAPHGPATFSMPAPVSNISTAPGATEQR